MTFILGLTGSIAMGKSTTAGLFRRLGVPVHDADAAVHALYAGAAVPLIESAFPGTTAASIVDRDRLRAAVLGNPEALHRLEAIVHPLVRESEQAFLKRAADAPLVVLDVPLLLETQGDRRCDAVVVATAPAAVQRERVLARPGTTVATLEQILSRQMPDAEKRRRAHFLVDTSRGLDSAEAQVRSILASLAGRPGRVLRMREKAG
ncbi:dephospho-CoA kinase [Microvirga massiliensis]|uniref:dephospho-CoA kinase n=1 Tax=Microvirga massiliensis TaxID=1033741 RepID=UPI00062B81AE|nr:dephospho-CoA kinase [Microvirga massiliensis]